MQACDIEESPPSYVKAIEIFQGPHILERLCDCVSTPHLLHVTCKTTCPFFDNVHQRPEIVNLLRQELQHLLNVHCNCDKATHVFIKILSNDFIFSKNMQRFALLPLIEELGLDAKGACTVQQVGHSLPISSHARRSSAKAPSWLLP